jgi:hypothetical protein
MSLLFASLTPFFRIAIDYVAMLWRFRTHLDDALHIDAVLIVTVVAA